MIVLELKFLAGRYHATPWGRNVNEGVPEWPPSPYRIARALIDVWKRRYPEWSEDRVKPLLNALAAPARFFLPPAVSAHTRSYLSSNQKDASKKQLIFDAFLALDKSHTVMVGFDAEIDGGEFQDLARLLEGLNYLGRSESWVEAGLSEDADAEWNCFPVSNGGSTGGAQSVRVACLLPEESYREQLFGRVGLSWIDALCVSTRELLKEGWSAPFLLNWTDYAMPLEQPLQSSSRLPLRSRFSCARYALSATVLPPVQETLQVAERIRARLMGIHKRIKEDNPALVSSLFSGKQPDGTPLEGHRHAFYIPSDEDGDGRIDHVTITSAEPFEEDELSSLDRLTSIWQPKGRPYLRFVLVSLSAESKVQLSESWVSATPFITSRHYRKGRGTYEQWLTAELCRECSFHGLPSPSSVEWIPRTLHTMHPVHWFEFTRSRKGQTPVPGYGCIISFKNAVSGPFSLGAGCHFGLGAFVPYLGANL